MYIIEPSPYGEIFIETMGGILLREMIKEKFQKKPVRNTNS